MRISHIEIKNILGIKTLKVDPKTLTIVEGKNGTGKSSFIEALKSAFGGGKDATLLHKGEKEGQIVVVLDDGTKFSRKVTDEGDAGTKIRDKDGPVGAVKSYTDKMLDVLALNPVAFLTAAEKDQAKMMLEAIPMEVTEDQIVKACGYTPKAIPKGHALDVINTVRATIFAERTELNREVKLRKNTIETLHQSLPDEGDLKDWTAEIERLADEEKALAMELGEIQRTATAAQVEADAASIAGYTKKLGELAGVRDAAIAAANAEYQAAKDRLDTRKGERITEASNTRAATINAAAERINPELQRIASELAGAKGKNEAWIKSKGVRELIDKTHTEAKEADEFAAMRTVAIEGLDKLLLKLTENLPIEGLKVISGKISVNDIGFDRLNTGERVKIAVKIAALRAKDLGIICADGLEVLDSESMAALEKELSECGLQAFVTRVSDEPFNVATV